MGVWGGGENSPMLEIVGKLDILLADLHKLLLNFPENRKLQVSCNFR